jgi:hypothetical protein
MIEDGDCYNWIMVPIGNCIKYIAEEIALTSLIHKSMSTLKGSGPLFKLAMQQLLKAKKPVANIDYLLAEQPYLVKSANELLNSDFDTINRHSLVSMWGSIEIALEDTIVLILMNDPTAIDALTNLSVKTKGFNKTAITEEDARKLYSRFERLIRSNLTVGDGYCKMLCSLSININCHNNVLDKLNEINSVRNCLLHKGGIIDEKAANLCPSLRPYKNCKFQIGEKLYLEYYEAISLFSQAFLESVVKSKYIRIKK